MSLQSQPEAMSQESGLSGMVTMGKCGQASWGSRSLREVSAMFGLSFSFEFFL